jgi:4-aminobutyrate aminotransferase-like enzyme
MGTVQTLEWLRRYESPNVTFIEPDGSWPIVWERARGAQVWDAEGRKYLDLTAAFGVAAAGHANRRVVRAGTRQMAKLLHAMGDVHPHALKAQLARALSRLTFERWNEPLARGASQVRPSPLAPRPCPEERQTQGQSQEPEGSRRGKTIFCNSGFEAVEAALKTARLATGKAGVIAFTGAYHGLGYGALNVTHREHFRSHFRGQLGEFGRFAPFPVRPEELPAAGEAIGRLLRRQPIGAVLVEPIQARGGVNIPPPEFLPLLRRLCDEHSALLILDEIYTGFGRTGKWFACEHTATVPDLICLGKALTGGFPLSACVGKSRVMDAAWPPSTGEAIHTSTFLGHPVGCAMALAQLEEIRARRLVQRSASLGRFLLSLLCKLAAGASALRLSARGLGLLAGLEVRAGDGSPATAAALGLLKTMLRSGFILLPEGEHANVLTFTPPLTISERDLATAVRALERALGGSR